MAGKTTFVCELGIGGQEIHRYVGLWDQKTESGTLKSCLQNANMSGNIKWQIKTIDIETIMVRSNIY